MQTGVDDQIKLIECPRDAMQSYKKWIPTDIKIEYINRILQVGFEIVDCGSFVSPKAIPQMRDTQQVIDALDLNDSKSKLSVIVANKRGAQLAVRCEKVSYLGFPFSVSPTFQMRNTNSTLEDSYSLLGEIQELCVQFDKKLLVYISMGFGNPYGDEWNTDIVGHWVEKLMSLGIARFALSDTIGIANPESIDYLFGALIKTYPQVTFGAHFHTTPTTWEEKLEAAYRSGCRHFDGAIKGYGGCPMAKDELTGNMPTENMVTYFNTADKLVINPDTFRRAINFSSAVFL